MGGLGDSYGEVGGPGGSCKGVYGAVLGMGGSNWGVEVAGDSSGGVDGGARAGGGAAGLTCVSPPPPHRDSASTVPPPRQGCRGGSGTGGGTRGPPGAGIAAACLSLAGGTAGGCRAPPWVYRHPARYDPPHLGALNGETPCNLPLTPMSPQAMLPRPGTSCCSCQLPACWGAAGPRPPLVWPRGVQGGLGASGGAQGDAERSWGV